MEEKQEFLLNKKLGKRISFLRKNNNISQEVLSEYLGISQKGLSKIETGKSFPKPVTLVKLAEFFNLEVKDIFLFSDLDSNSNTLKNIQNKIKIIKNDTKKLKALEIFLENII